VFKHFPLYSIHRQAAKAAEAAECAAEQGAFWEMHDALFEGQGAWSGGQNAVQTFKNMARDLGLDQAQFDACLDGGTYTAKVTADYQQGIADGASSAPTFLINGTLLVGAYPLEAFQQRIDYFVAGGEPPTLVVEADSFRSLGQPDAPVVITEFSDFQ